jgi:hypothetical protein
MLLHGSCHCGAVRFRVESPHPYPFNLCYCSICRKTAGGGGFAINLGGEFATLEVDGEENISVYRAKIEDPDKGILRQSPGERRFCKVCGSCLWVWDPRWPELVHPFASAIDTELPRPPERTHLMLDFKAPWVDIHNDPQDQLFPRYPDESIAEWHSRLGLEEGT